MKGTANTSGKKGRKSVGIVIDVAMAVTLVATMATALMRDHPLGDPCERRLQRLS